MTLTIAHPTDFQSMVGHELGPSAELAVTQEMIDTFAKATGDHQWIHTDPVRARKESPYGTTIAHGYLTLSLLAQLQDTIFSVENVDRAVNYGANKLRMISPVPVDSRIQLTQIIKGADPIGDDGTKVTIENTFTVVGAPKPALVIETIGLFFASAPASHGVVGA